MLPPDPLIPAPCTSALQLSLNEDHSSSEYVKALCRLTITPDHPISTSLLPATVSLLLSSSTILIEIFSFREGSHGEPTVEDIVCPPGGSEPANEVKGALTSPCPGCANKGVVIASFGWYGFETWISPSAVDRGEAVLLICCNCLCSKTQATRHKPTIQLLPISIHLPFHPVLPCRSMNSISQ